MLSVFLSPVTDENAAIPGAWVRCLTPIWKYRKAREMHHDAVVQMGVDPDEDLDILSHTGFGTLLDEAGALEEITLELIEEIALTAEQVGEERWPRYLEYCEALGERKSAQAFNDAYQGIYSTLGEWASVQYEDRLSLVPEDIKQFVDTEKMGQTAVHNGDIFTVDVGTGLVVFLNT